MASGRPEQAALGGIHCLDSCHAARFRHCGRTREPIEPATCRNCASIAFSQNGESIAPLVPAYTYFSRGLHWIPACAGMTGRNDYTSFLPGHLRNTFALDGFSPSICVLHLDRQIRTPFIQGQPQDVCAGHHRLRTQQQGRSARFTVGNEVKHSDRHYPATQFQAAGDSHKSHRTTGKLLGTPSTRLRRRHG